MKDNINENKKGIENESGSFENEGIVLEDLIAENNEKKQEVMSEFDDHNVEAQEKIQEAFEESDPEKQQSIDKEKEMFERARDVVKEYDDTVGKITKDKPDIEVEAHKDLESNEIKREISNEEVEAIIEEYLNSKGKVSVKDKNNFENFVEDKINKAINSPKTRRDILKIIGGVAVALVSKDYLLDNLGKWWAEHAENKEIYKERVSLKEIALNLELIKEIDQTKNVGIPEILDCYKKEQSYEENKIKFKFGIDAKINNNEVNKRIYFSEYSGNVDSRDAMFEELKKKNMPMDSYNSSTSLELFIKKKQDIIEIINKNLGVSKENIEKYVETFFSPDVSNVEVVEFEKFHINKDFKIESELVNKRNEIFQKYNNPSITDPGFHQADEEFKKWAHDEKGIADAQKTMNDEVEKSERFSRLKDKEKKELRIKDYDKFKELVFKEINNSEFDFEKLKEIGENDPGKILEYISKLIIDKAHYSLLEYSNIIYNNIISATMGQNLTINGYLEEKHSKGIPEATLESGSGVCHDYAMTYAAVKFVLEKEGIPNLDKCAVFQTTSESMNHEWVNIVTVDENGKLIITSIDPTWHDTRGKLNAVDSEYHYTKKEKKSEAKTT